MCMRIFMFVLCVPCAHVCVVFYRFCMCACFRRVGRRRRRSRRQITRTWVVVNWIFFVASAAWRPFAEHFSDDALGILLGLPVTYTWGLTAGPGTRNSEDTGVWFSSRESDVDGRTLAHKLGGVTLYTRDERSFQSWCARRRDAEFS